MERLNERIYENMSLTNELYNRLMTLNFKMISFKLGDCSKTELMNYLKSMVKLMEYLEADIRLLQTELMEELNEEKYNS
jgi:hypothetical protein